MGGDCEDSPYCCSPHRDAGWLPLGYHLVAGHRLRSDGRPGVGDAMFPDPSRRRVVAPCAAHVVLQHPFSRVE